MATLSYSPLVHSSVANGLKAVAMVGTYSVIVAWDCPKSEITNDHLGFAVKRRDFDAKTKQEIGAEFLRSDKRFAGHMEDVDDVRSNDAPFQRFRWNDYGLRKDRYYEYEVYPTKGEPGNIKLGKPVKVTVVPSREMQDGLGVYVNRGVTSARAYLRRFKNKHPSEVGSEAYEWLSRGLKESLLSFIAETPIGCALHVCIYEFFDEEVAAALKVAAQHIDVKIVYHAKLGDKATEESKHLVEKKKLKRLTEPRAKTGGISHNKFIVRLRGAKPVAVWTGTANFSENAFYFQTNAALSIKNADIASVYERYFKVLEADTPLAKKSAITDFAQDLVAEINAEFQSVGSIKKVCFSPVRGLDLILIAEDLIRSAKSCVFVSAPFALDPQLVGAIKGNNKSVLEYGLSNTATKSKLMGLQQGHMRFLTPSVIKTYMGKAWDAKAFGGHKIHAKMIIADPWSSHPRVLFGSSNHSDESCKKNDENNLLIEGDHRLAAILTTEFMRMFDHYNSRDFIKRIEEKGGTGGNPLTPDSSWSRTAFSATATSHKFRDRLVFSGQV